MLGVGRDDLGAARLADRFAVVKGLIGGNFEGTVPARARLMVGWVAASAGGTKSGNPSWLGDSGIVSRNGVDPPEVGGPPHGLVGVTRPSCA